MRTGARAFREKMWEQHASARRCARCCHNPRRRCTMNDALRTTLKTLRLSGLAQSLEVRLQEAAGHTLNHAEFLELILQDELTVRAERQLARRVKAAMFRDPKTLEDFDWQFNPSIKKKQIYD